jgi:hypothetical protein
VHWKKGGNREHSGLGESFHNRNGQSKVLTPSFLARRAARLRDFGIRAFGPLGSRSARADGAGRTGNFDAK